MAATLGAIALVPDEAVLRPKVAWSQALALAAFGLALLQQAWMARLPIRWLGVVLTGLIPGLVGLLWWWTGPLTSRSLAWDENTRILLVTVIVWTTSVVLATRALRTLCWGTLVCVTVPVAGLAVAQNLAGQLDLPVDRVARAASTFGNPVFLGAYLVLAIPLCAAAALFGSGILRWMGALATGLALPALLATQSRWAWLGGAAAMACGIVLLAPTRRYRRTLLVCLVAGAALLAALSWKVIQRPQSHALIWHDTLRMIAEHPWGVGPGQFQVAFLPYASPELLAAYPRSSVIINDAHCEPLQILAELGWPGFLAVLAWLTLLLMACLRRLRSMAPTDLERPFLAAIIAALVGSVVQSLGSPDLRFLISSMVFATLAGLAAAMDEPANEPRRAPLPLRFAMAGAGVFVIGWAGHTLLERSRLVAQVRPRDPYVQTADTTHRLLDLLAAVKRDSGNPELHYNLGVALAEAHRYREAALALRKAAALSPGRATVVRSLGVVEALGGEFAPAVDHLRIALESYPAEAELSYLLAYSSYGLGDIATAIRELEALLATHPEHPQAHLLLEKLRE